MDDFVEGAVRNGAGRVEDAAGALSGDLGMQWRGKLNEAAGSAQKIYGEVMDQAGAALVRAKDQVRGVYDEVEDHVREQPLTALGIGVIAGFLLGLAAHGANRRHAT